MSEQFELVLARPRRIDVTIERLAQRIDSLGEEEREKLYETKTWSLVELAANLRCLERSEEGALGRDWPTPIADAYDRLAQPGEPAHEALLKALQAVWPQRERAA